MNTSANPFDDNSSFDSVCWLLNPSSDSNNEQDYFHKPRQPKGTLRSAISKTAQKFFKLVPKSAVKPAARRYSSSSKSFTPFNLAAIYTNNKTDSNSGDFDSEGFLPLLCPFGDEYEISSETSSRVFFKDNTSKNHVHADSPRSCSPNTVQRMHNDIDSKAVSAEIEGAKVFCTPQEYTNLSTYEDEDVVLINIFQDVAYKVKRCWKRKSQPSEEQKRLLNSSESVHDEDFTEDDFDYYLEHVAPYLVREPKYL